MELVATDSLNISADKFPSLLMLFMPWIDRKVIKAIIRIIPTNNFNHIVIFTAGILDLISNRNTKYLNICDFKRKK